ncbi:hypothetical protein D3C71_716410 [compost metagenome]
MNTKIFKLEAKLPKVGKQVSIFTSVTDSENRDRKTAESLKSLSKLFGVSGRAADDGEKMILSEKSKSISVYQASNSFWYQDDDFFAREDKKFSQNLPDARTAQEKALRFLKENGLLLNSASFHSVTHTTVVATKPNEKKGDEYNTEVHVNFRYSLDGLPVFGPGAKTRVSFVSDKINSGVYHFWREVTQEKKARDLIDPELALEIHAKNFRFASLKEGAAKVIIKEMELGYFAMSPTELQRALIPVYKISGVISTEALPEYAFTHHVVAVKYNEDDIKTMGFNIGSVKSLVF